MTKIAVRDLFPEDLPIEVNDIEILNKETIPTYFLMKKLEEKYGDENEFHFIIGSDLIPTLHLWHEFKSLKSEINFVIYNRVGYEINLENKAFADNFPEKYIYNPVAKNLFGEISSTEVRNRI